MAATELVTKALRGKSSRQSAIAGQPCQPRFITDDSRLELAVAALKAADPVPIERMLELVGAPPLRKREGGLKGLVGIIVSQQVSTASARAIFARVEQRFGDFHHSMLLAASDDDFRSCGLSTPKIRTLRHVAAAIADGGLDFAELTTLDADAARARMTAIKGIGPWTSDIYLLFCLGHPDVWPAGDLALQEGVRLALRLRARPDAKRLEKISQRWRPFRAAAARLVWAYYTRSLALKREARNPGRR